MVLLRSLGRRGSRSRALDAPFPAGLSARLRRTHPQLDDDALALVEQGLRQWFAVCQEADGARVAMPSVVVDDLWHELVLHTAAYAQFCRDALGRFLHHTPEEAMDPADAHANVTWRLRRTYDLAREVEGVPTSLPLLFRIDEQLGVHRGRVYVRECGTTVCSVQVGVTCLGHLPRPPRGDGDPGSSAWIGGDGDSHAGGGGDGGGCGGGCGGGS